MEYENISKKAVVLWEIALLLLFAGLVMLTLYVLSPHTWLWYTVLWLLGAVYILSAFLYLPLYYLSHRFKITDEVVVYKKGVLFPRTEILYRNSIVFVTVYHNPLTPLLKISSVVIDSAGAKQKLFLINTKRAKEIARLLTEAKGA